MEDEDIKLVEERIDYFKNNPEGCNWKLSFEDDKDIQAIENLLSRLKTAERMIDVLADNLRILYAQQEPCEMETMQRKECAKYENCFECIIEYFRNKAKESE